MFCLKLKVARGQVQLACFPGGVEFMPDSGVTQRIATQGIDPSGALMVCAKDQLTAQLTYDAVNLLWHFTRTPSWVWNTSTAAMNW